MVPRLLRTFGTIQVDTRDWPVIALELPESRVADAELEATLEYLTHVMRECAKDHERCVQVTDASRMRELPPASQRKLTGDWAKSTVPLQKVVSLGGANVTPSAIIRGIITAIHWFYEPVTPVAFFATRSEAMQQAITWLEQGQVPIPPQLRALQEKLAATKEPRREKPWSRWAGLR